MNRMPRWRVIAPTLAAVLLALAALAPASGSAALADDLASPSPVAIATTTGTGAYDLGTEPALPYVAALLVTSGGLTLVGFLAMRVQRRSSNVTGRRALPGWWSCETCAASNPADRATCFACRTPRASPPEDGQTTDATARSDAYPV